MNEFLKKRWRANHGWSAVWFGAFVVCSGTVGILASGGPLWLAITAPVAVSIFCWMTPPTLL